MEQENSFKNSVEVIMSCMYQEGFDIAYRTKIDSDVLIINQCNKDAYEEITVNGYTWRMIYTTDRGAARSRNKAIENARGDYLLFCDDDEELSEGYAKLIQDAFAICPKATGVVFNIERKNLEGSYKYYTIKKIRKAPFYRGYGAPMLAIKRVNIISSGIRMDERFGSGSKWSCGEESLFEVDMVRSKLYIYENPNIIATVDYSHGSQWYDGMNQRYFYNQGAYTQRVYKSSFVRLFRRIYRCFRTRHDKTLSFSEKMRWIKNGMNGYVNNQSYKEFVENK